MGSANGGHQAEDDAGERRNGRGKREHAPVDAEIKLRGVVVNGQEPKNGFAQCPCQCETGRRASERQHQAVTQRLADEPQTGGAECKADGELALARTGAGQHEIAQIGAGDQQDESGNSQQQPERGVVLVAQRADAVWRRRGFQPESFVVFHCLCRIPRWK